MFLDQFCRFYLHVNSDNTLEHFCKCPYLVQIIPEVSTIDPGAIYGTLDNQVKAVKIWRKVFSQLENMETTRSTILPVPHVQSVDPSVNPICT